MPIEKYTASINTGKVRNLEKPGVVPGAIGSGISDGASSTETEKVRLAVMIIVGIHGFVSLLSLISSLLTGNGIVATIIRTLLTAALLYQVLQGKNWARWVTVVLTILAALAFLLGALAVIALGGTGIGILIVLIAVGYLACAIALLVPPASKYFDAR